MAKLTKAKQGEVEQLVMDGHSLVRACVLAKVNRSMLYKKMGEDSEFESAIRLAQRQSAEKALEELDELYSDALHKRKDYDPNVLRDYATHVRWKASKVISDRYGEAKQRAGVEVSDGTVRIVWETSEPDAS
jgi:hypothetical protein